MPIYTIGYEGLTIESFLVSIQEYCIQTIIDVRQVPISRKTGFSKSSLNNSLKDININYTHFKTLGCPQYIRQSYKENHDWLLYCKSFNQYLLCQGESLDEISYMADDFSCALLCFEADYKYCHRSLIANAIKHKTGKRISHIVN